MSVSENQLKGNAVICQGKCNIFSSVLYQKQLIFTGSDTYKGAWDRDLEKIAFKVGPGGL